MFGFKFSVKRNPKTTFTLQQFYNAVEKVKIETGATHHCVYIEMIGFGRGNLVLKAYLDNPPRFYIGKTVEEVCDGLRKKEEQPSPVKEIIIELPNEIAA